MLPLNERVAILEAAQRFEEERRRYDEERFGKLFVVMEQTGQHLQTLTLSHHAIADCPNTGKVNKLWSGYLVAAVMLGIMTAFGWIGKIGTAAWLWITR